ncbi:hypothetical protein Nepgr_006267 [Nepenthes gracilis]|uniref:Uncharacterized protein n=1 Tax=Nepenthes gracilis TaxID=150966 RepID=A0AAD3S4T5_NEPGR|nr:hypothetical protein Nepgr_006267 [Nepenthes gracilis]
MWGTTTIQSQELELGSGGSGVMLGAQTLSESRLADEHNLTMADATVKPFFNTDDNKQGRYGRDGTWKKE